MTFGSIKSDETTIILDSKLGLLLKRKSLQKEAGENAAPQNGELPHGCVWNKMSRLQQWESIRDKTLCPDERSCANRSICSWTGAQNDNATCHPCFSGGIDLPNPENNTTGTGVIVITGEFGAGKSTLAFQLASACVDEPNKMSSVYVSVEMPPLQVCREFTNENIPRHTQTHLTDYPQCYSHLNYNPVQQEWIRTGRNTPTIHIANWPASMEEEKRPDPVMIFKKLSDWCVSSALTPERNPVKMIVVDSLTVLQNQFGLRREQIGRLFDTFRKANIVAVFTLEDRSAESAETHQFVNDAKYEADTVIALRRTYSHDYYLTDIEIEKSRYQEKVQGRHAYKIRQRTNDELEADPHPLARKVLEIYPSAHYTMTAYESYVPVPAIVPQRSQTTLFGDTEKRGVFSHILPQMLTKDSYNRDTLQTKPDGQIITITGESGLYKSDLAVNALLAGMVEHAPKASAEQKKGENGLILRLNSGASLLRGGVRLNRTVKELYADEGAYSNGIDLWEWRPDGISKGKPPFNVLNKYDMTAWRLDRNPEKKGAVLFEVEFKRGAILLEEMLDTIFRLVSAYDIQRVCLIDLKSIGVDYPFLIDSKTSGKMFLTSLVNWMRVYRKDLIFSATPCGIPDSDTEILRAKTLSDTVVSCERDGDVVISSSFDTINRHRYIVSLCDDTNLGDIRLHPVGAPYMSFPMPMFEVKRD